MQWNLHEEVGDITVSQELLWESRKGKIRREKPVPED
jgi:hypothetical protein